ncbi:hypothetical protein C5C18_07320 [Rathayibacter tritici]|uniref:hypothetical protein n=1 Tax=Rathayibacter tritici TaxID=33888 RepID=UPI000CE8D447|nr:hypothetical protein [Rathayibacter tritici]PPF29991.1 hypothetical protein C5C06_05820 [Rathayibacter tritici]PPF68688.1 hypothetical protein C5C21_04740 [Rathayibacter tritici]PPG07346.1 hypothetical protein C5C18_07320 [Rathayibacter tritici]PPI11962.1 hypothetical protein C5D07_13285 [Rathayibacter tritici]
MRDEVATIARIRGRVSPEAIATVELARRLGGLFVLYEVADSDPQYDLRYRCSGSATSQSPRLWRRVSMPLLTESGRRCWVSLDRDFADDAKAVRAVGGDEVAVEVPASWRRRYAVLGQEFDA